jgi:hypothetical protein
MPGSKRGLRTSIEFQRLVSVALGTTTAMGAIAIMHVDWRIRNANLRIKEAASVKERHSQRFLGGERTGRAPKKEEKRKKEMRKTRGYEDERINHEVVTSSRGATSDERGSEGEQRVANSKVTSDK